MKTKREVLCLIVFLVACGPAGFTSKKDQKTQQSGDAASQPVEEGEVVVAPDPTLNPDPPSPPKDELILEVSAPSPEIRSGNEKMPIKAVIKDGDPNPDVVWTISGPEELNRGAIDENGVYSSPAEDQEPFSIEIIATLREDPAVSDSVSIRIIPTGQIFVRCVQGNQVFPVLADVYEIPENTEKLPNFNNLQKKTTVCLDRYAVSERRFDAGFPDLPELFEWFALRTKTTLIVPKSGLYTFRLRSDDGSKLYLDGKPLIDNDGIHSSENKEGTLELSKGEHALNLDYFQGPRYDLSLELFWLKPGSGSFEIVPRESFK